MADGQFSKNSRELQSAFNTHPELAEIANPIDFILHQIDEMISIINFDGKYLYTNKNHVEILGYQVDEIYELGAFELIHPDDSDFAKKTVEEIKRAKTPEQIRFRYLHKNKNYVWLESFGTPILDKNGEARALLVCSRDITKDVVNQKLLDVQHKLVEYLSQATGFQEALSNALSLLLEIDDVEGGAVLIKNSEGDKFVPESIIDITDEFNAIIRDIEISVDFALDYLQNRKAVYISLTEIFDLFGIDKSSLKTYNELAILPIRHKEEVIAFIIISSRDNQSLSQIIKKSLENIIYHVSGLISRIKTEEALKDSQELFSNLIQQTSDAILLTDPDGKIVIWNKGSELISGYSTAEMIGKDIIEVISVLIPDQKQYIHLFQESFAKIDKGEMDSLSIVETPIITKQGELKLLQGVLFIVETSHGNWYGGINRDITATKNMTDEIIKSEHQLNTVFNAVSEMLILTDSENRIIRTNQHADTFFERITDSIQGKDINRLLFNTTETGLSPGEVYIPHLHVWLDVTIYNVQLDDNKSGKAYALLDISTQKEMEAALVSSQKLADLGTLAAGIAHEINSPLQIIIGMSDRLKRKLTDDQLDIIKAQKDLENINKTAWRVARIVRSLLSYSRDTTDSLELKSINKIIRDSLLLLEHQLSSFSNLSIHTDMEEGLPKILSDGNKLSQAIINLILNARDAMPNGGTIRIRTRSDKENGVVKIEVEDEGMGIDENHIEKIFNPFFTTKPIGKGTGLGLSIVMGIIKEHQGEIEVSSNPGEGSCFTITLPIAK